MKSKVILTFNANQLKLLFNRKLPKLVGLAMSSDTLSVFLTNLSQYVSEYANDKRRAPIVKRILLLIKYESSEIYELSINEKMSINTMEYLWQFLRADNSNINCTDLYLDIYFMFLALESPVEIKPDRAALLRKMKRWESGLDKAVINIRNNNISRIKELLVKKIEARHSKTSKYIFSENLSSYEKYQLIEEWWKESKFHLSMAIKSPKELNLFMGHSLSIETMGTLIRAKKKGIPFFITPYYLSLLNIGKSGFDDAAIRSYILYSENLVETYGNIKAWEKEDIVEQGVPNAAGWLIPSGGNIHRRYPEVAILIPDSMGRACGGLCASCQRMYDFQRENLNFDFESLKPKEAWDEKLRKLMNYFEEDSQLRDILITGGDAFMSQNKTLRNILTAVYKMAVRKKRSNLTRKDGQKYAELQRVRLGSRLLAYLPLRINDELVDILREFKEKASKVGISQFIVQTHFQSPLEVTPEAECAIKKILSAGWTITNQLVYTVAASRTGHTAKLRQILNSQGVICYYTFSVKGFNENYAVFAPNSRSMQEANEEKIFGQVSIDKKPELHEIIKDKSVSVSRLSDFLERNNLPFVATDRNVLNLPAIGKSMSFVTVGVTKDGKRILQFDHDSTRQHSPIIDKMGKIYIVESKSIAAYLRQLEIMGENIEEYDSIWRYSEGETEPCFSLFEYPEYDFKHTSEITNY